LVTVFLFFLVAPCRDEKGGTNKQITITSLKHNRGGKQLSLALKNGSIAHNLHKVHKHLPWVSLSLSLSLCLSLFYNFTTLGFSFSVMTFSLTLIKASYDPRRANASSALCSC